MSYSNALCEPGTWARHRINTVEMYIPREGSDLRWQSIGVSGGEGTVSQATRVVFVRRESSPGRSPATIQTGWKSLVSRSRNSMTLARSIGCQDEPPANWTRERRRHVYPRHPITNFLTANMVLLCMTPLAARAITEARKVAGDGLAELCLPEEPPLADPVAGNPISHGQLIGIAKLLRKHADKTTARDEGGEVVSYTLDSLLRGCTLYIPPPPPKKEPVSSLLKLKLREHPDKTNRHQNTKPSWHDSAKKKKQKHTNECLTPTLPPNRLLPPR